MTAYGYIRKSVVHDPSRMLSPEMQEAAIRKLAEYHGDDDLTILSDLDRSGRLDRTRRPGWDQILTAIEDGEASAVYAYSLSRFARTVTQLTEFRLLCERQGTAFRTVKEHLDTTSPTGRLYFGFQAVLEEFWADVTSERVKDAFATKRAKDPTWEGPGNRPYGSKPDEDAQAVVDAFKEAGSYDGAARLLHERGIPSRGKHEDGVGWWYGTTVRDIIKRVAPDLVLPGTSRGSAAGTRQFRLARLLRCSTCGTLMTGSYDRRHDATNYYCRLARVTPHARGNVLESKLLPTIEAEAERMLIKVSQRRQGTAEDEAKLVALAAERDRVRVMFRKGHIEEADLDRAMVEIAEEESRLSAVRIVRHIKFPPMVRTGDPGVVNTFLRRLFVSATVDMSEPGRRGPSSWMPAIDFEWRDESLRLDEKDLERPIKVVSR